MTSTRQMAPVDAEQSFQEVDARKILRVETTFLDSLPSFPAEHCPLLPDRQQTERVVSASIQAVVRRIDVRDLKDLLDIL
jgi:hypothetical protein